MFRHQLIAVFVITILVSHAISSLIRLEPTELTLKPSSSTSLKSVVCAVNILAISNKKPPDNSSFTLSALDPALCTHLMLVNAGAIVNSKLTVGVSENLANEIKLLKNRNPSLHIILSIGGWEAGVKGFQEVGRDKRKLTFFVDSVGSYLRNNDYIDSVALLWMWPTISYRGGDDKDQNDVTVIAYELSTAFKQLPNNPTLGLILPGHLIGPGYKGYDLKKLDPLISTFYVMAQDFTGNWGGVTETGHPAPLYSPKQSINSTISELLKTLPAQKLVLGLPFFGRSFLLKNTHPNGFNQPHEGYFKSSFDNNPISIKYQEICHLVVQKKFSIFYDNESVGMFGVSGKQWVGFDGVESLREKIAFVEEHDLNGVMPWTIDYDDYNGKWCGGKWALLGGLLASSGSGTSDSSSSTGNEVETGSVGQRDNENHGHHQNGNNNAGHQASANGGNVVGVNSMKVMAFFCSILVYASFY